MFTKNKPVVQSASIGAENTYTSALQLDTGDAASILAIVPAAFTGTLRLERSFDEVNYYPLTYVNGTKITWAVAAAAADTVVNTSFIAEEKCFIRLGCATGAYTSGTATARIGRS